MAKVTYSQQWMEIKKKAKLLANAYEKPVKIYRKIKNNRPAEFCMSLADFKRLDEAVFIEAVNPDNFAP